MDDLLEPIHRHRVRVEALVNRTDTARAERERASA
jgi:hypothetical protein